MPFVIFNKHASPDTSWCDEVVNVMRPHALGNPYRFTEEDERLHAIGAYEGWLWEIMKYPDEPAAKEIARLKKLHQEGKNIALVCCCVPKRCHAEVIVEVCTK